MHPLGAVVLAVPSEVGMPSHTAAGEVPGDTPIRLLEPVSTRCGFEPAGAMHLATVCSRLLIDRLLVRVQPEEPTIKQPAEPICGLLSLRVNTRKIAMYRKLYRKNNSALVSVEH